MCLYGVGFGIGLVCACMWLYHKEKAKVANEISLLREKIESLLARFPKL